MRLNREELPVAYKTRNFKERQRNMREHKQKRKIDRDSYIKCIMASSIHFLSYLGERMAEAERRERSCLRKNNIHKGPSDILGPEQCWIIFKRIKIRASAKSGYRKQKRIFEK